MNKALMTATFLMLSSGLALAADTATPPTTTKSGDAATKAMDAATPTVKSDDPITEHPPAAAMDKAVPPMKPDDKATDSKDSTTTTPE
jgi:hypothetical protein